MGGEAGFSEELDMCLRVQVVGSAGLSFDGGPLSEVIPTPIPAIEPCLVARDESNGSTPSIDRTGGGVAVLLFLVADGLSGLVFFSPSSAAITSRRSASRAASKLMIGVCGARARVGELFPAMTAGGRSGSSVLLEEGTGARGSRLSGHSELQSTLPSRNHTTRRRIHPAHSHDGMPRRCLLALMLGSAGRRLLSGGVRLDLSIPHLSSTLPW